MITLERENEKEKENFLIYFSHPSLGISNTNELK
jgi:hypothetical protein